MLSIGEEDSVWLYGATDSIGPRCDCRPKICVFLLTQVRVVAYQSRISADARPENSPSQVLDESAGNMELESHAIKRNQVEQR
jgi:hypothetical protein